MLYITIKKDMSDFFASLTQGNVRFPDARINGDGPLPTTLSGPAGIHGDPDGKYNFNDREILVSSIFVGLCSLSMCTYRDVVGVI